MAGDAGLVAGLGVEVCVAGGESPARVVRAASVELAAGPPQAARTKMTRRQHCPRPRRIIPMFSLFAMRPTKRRPLTCTAGAPAIARRTRAAPLCFDVFCQTVRVGLVVALDAVTSQGMYHAYCNAKSAKRQGLVPEKRMHRDDRLGRHT